MSRQHTPRSLLDEWRDGDVEGAAAASGGGRGAESVPTQQLAMDRSALQAIHSSVATLQVSLQQINLAPLPLTFTRTFLQLCSAPCNPPDLSRCKTPCAVS